jgi:hypothetical protein
MNKVRGISGFVAFALGLLIALVVGIINTVVPIGPAGQSAIVVVLVILGIIVGALNIVTREIIPLLLATVALIVVGGVFAPLTALGIGSVLDNILKLVATLVAPAAVIAAVRALWAVGFPTKE